MAAEGRKRHFADRVGLALAPAGQFPPITALIDHPGSLRSSIEVGYSITEYRIPGSWFGSDLSPAHAYYKSEDTAAMISDAVVLNLLVHNNTLLDSNSK
jgi:hypothetical protein